MQYGNVLSVLYQYEREHHISREYAAHTKWVRFKAGGRTGGNLAGVFSVSVQYLRRPRRHSPRNSNLVPWPWKLVVTIRGLRA